MDEPDSVSRALGNVLILSTIMERSDFETLKKLRLVNKYWNNTACVLLRKLCKAIEVDDDLKFDSRFDSHLPNRDIIVKLPLDVDYYTPGDSTKNNFKEFMEQRFARVRWLDQVVYLNLYMDSSVADVNRVTPYLLQYLPALKELQLHVGYYHTLYPENWSIAVPSFAPDAKFKLEKLLYCGFRWKTTKGYAHNMNDEEIDPTFLRHCRNLRKIAYIGKTAAIFMGFYQNWKKMVHENPNFHRIPQIQINLGNIVKSLPLPKTAELLEALIDFINMNKPTWLDISGKFISYNSVLFPKLGIWEPSIHYLKMRLQSEINVDHGHYAMRMLENCPSFAHLTEIHLELNEGSEDEATGRPLELDHDSFQKRACRGTNSLEHVTTLTIWIPGIDRRNSCFLQQVTAHLHNVTRLTLILPSFRPFATYPGEDESENDHFDELLDDCKNLPKLSLICFQVNVDDADIMPDRIDEIIEEDVSGGFLKNLSGIKALKKLEINLKRWDDGETFPYKMEEFLVALFHGYEPHVSLEIKCSPGYRCELTVEEFKQKLKEAEEYLEIAGDFNFNE